MSQFEVKHLSEAGGYLKIDPKFVTLIQLQYLIEDYPYILSIFCTLVIYSNGNGFPVTFSQSHLFSSFAKTEFRIIYGKAADLLELQLKSHHGGYQMYQLKKNFIGKGRTQRLTTVTKSKKSAK